ncbi:MAG: 3-hydroxyanthranilate 3,4-dioxygenase [Candidatus Kapaibacteriota bacterium]|jgi:3-hydroxyanthranilate 3,4-dioxygenase
MSLQAPFNLNTWIEEHRDLLRPPVGNAKVFEDGDFIIMVVGGPNSRKDYHFNHGQEFFYQLEGDITVKVIDNGTPRDIHVRQGDVFLLPGEVPHSPQRPANTVGIVIERKRQPEELDAFQWYCENCGTKLYEEFLPLKDIVKELPPLFQRFYGDVNKRTCASCGTIMEPPASL